MSPKVKTKILIIIYLQGLLKKAAKSGRKWFVRNLAMRDVWPPLLQCYNVTCYVKEVALRPSASRREGGEGRGRPWQEGRRATGMALAGGRQGSWRGSVKTCLSLWFSPFGARCSSLFFYFLTW